MGSAGIGEGSRNKAVERQATCALSWVPQLLLPSQQPWRDPALSLADRVFHSLNPARPDCGLLLGRDRNAARNILARGTGTVSA